MQEIYTLFISSFIPLVLGLVIGLLIDFSFARVKRRPASLLTSSDTNLQNEILQDQVKQLEAKIKTLEKALEISK